MICVDQTMTGRYCCPAMLELTFGKTRTWEIKGGMNSYFSYLINGIVVFDQWLALLACRGCHTWQSVGFLILGKCLSYSEYITTP
jgi:hypothetical protein